LSSAFLEGSFIPGRRRQEGIVSPKYKKEGSVSPETFASSAYHGQTKPKSFSFRDPHLCAA
jgi:hypothetical protein